MPRAHEKSKYETGLGRVALVLVLLCAAASAWFVPACRSGAEPRVATSGKPTLRVYVVGSIAGALEPCGCVKDMLGGFDHATAFVRSDAASQPRSLIAGAGPMFFSNPKLPAVGSEQHRFKAQAIAESFRALGVAAWAPSVND